MDELVVEQQVEARPRPHLRAIAEVQVELEAGALRHVEVRWQIKTSVWRNVPLLRKVDALADAVKAIATLWNQEARRQQALCGFAALALQRIHLCGAVEPVIHLGEHP